MIKDPVIIQFDDDDSFFTVVELIAYNMDLKIAGKAKNIEQARGLIHKIESGELKPDIAIIANYLGNGFQDGELLTKKLKAIYPSIKVISYVTDPETNWGDYLAIKGSKVPSQTLTMSLCELTGKEFKASNIKDSEGA